jgi:light-regulated signal transduction histidine kinase (bacteriophytochrome)
MDAADNAAGRQQLQDALRQNEELKRALEDCTSARQNAERELARTLEVAQSAAEEMQHFIYAVSHDLRTPLRSVSGYAKLLQRQYAANQETSELTAFIVDGAAEMNTLIEGLLTYSRTGNSPRRTTVNLGAIVQFALMNLQAQIREAGAEIKMGELPELAIDESQFIQLFQQIIGNALKFRSAESPKVEVTAEEQPDQYVVAVRDNGPGIDPKYQETVFAPFKRLHGREVPGTGLGLAICKKIVRAHGGKIWVESDGTYGSTLKFTVPL